MPIITLTTDFGTRDAFAAAMKGVIWSIAPAAQIADLSHEVPPQDVWAGALLLGQACRFFPAGTIHVAVVDPGVGGARRAVAVQTDRYVFAGPDNGLLSIALRLERVTGAVVLDNPVYHRHPVSQTFHGRDIFAPCAAHLAAGAPFSSLGSPLSALAALPVPEPLARGGALEIHVLSTDRFGNLLTDMSLAHFSKWNPLHLPVRVQAGAVRIENVRQTFGSVPPGTPLAYFGSSGLLEIAVNRGRADAVLNLKPGGTLLLEII